MSGRRGERESDNIQLQNPAILMLFSHVFARDFTTEKSISEKKNELPEINKTIFC